jgi:apolipoprotein D and lipocalin family protein
MKILPSILFFTFISLGLSQTPLYSQSPQAVNHVDAKNFSGLWYEIARTYNSFEKNCVAATVEYKLVEPYEYEVINRCFEHEIGGNLIIYNGTAQPLQEKNMSQIEKTYFWIFSKDYKIIYLENYTTAVMADEDMENVWIMHREPFLNEKKLDSIVSMLSQYMDVSELIFTPQDINGRYK